MVTDEIKFLSAVAENAIPMDIQRLIDVISELTVAGDQHLNDHEVGAAYDILLHLYPRAETAVRRLLSERLAARGDIPRSLALLLANDSIDIAAPLLRNNPGLCDDDLVEIVSNGTLGHRLAVCDRPTLSEALTDVLAYLGDPQVMVALVKNPGAALSNSTLRRLVVASRNIEALHAPLLNRREMTENLAVVMYHWVGESLRRFISQSFGDSMAELVADEIANSVRDGYSSSVNEGKEEEANWISILVALRAGNFGHAERLLQTLSDLEPSVVEMLMYHDDGRGLAVLCRAYNGSRMMFSELYDRLHGTVIYGNSDAHRQRSAALAAFNNTNQGQAAEVLLGWTGDPSSVWGNRNHTNLAYRQRSQGARPS